MHKLVGRIIRPIWRMRRGLTMGAQGIVLNEMNEVLLVRHGYRPGWHFPGGGVEWNETAMTALRRELHEETGVIVDGIPRLHGLFTNFTVFPGDHIAVFIVSDWNQPQIPAPNHEIAEQRFFATNELPEDTTRGAMNRLGELFANRPLSETWL